MTFKSLRSHNFPNLFVRHQAFRGKVSEIHSDLDKNDATFDIQNLPHNPIRFKSINFPSRVLRHRNFEIYLDEFNPPILPPGGQHSPEDQQTSKDSAFVMVDGLAGTGVSFQSTNFPDRFIRHRGFLLFLELADSDLARNDATFFVVDPFVTETFPPLG